MTEAAFHPDAPTDLDEIRGSIAEYSLEAADRVVNEILDRIEALVPFPHQGFRRPNLTSRPLRFVLVREYLIAYPPEKQPLWVVRSFADGATLV